MPKYDQIGLLIIRDSGTDNTQTASVTQPITMPALAKPSPSSRVWRISSSALFPKTIPSAEPIPQNCTRDSTSEAIA